MAHLTSKDATAMYQQRLRQFGQEVLRKQPWATPQPTLWPKPTLPRPTRQKRPPRT